MGSEKKVVRKANIVQRKSLELKFRGKDEIVSRERVENVKKTSGSKGFTPMWVEEPKLPSGWKSCVAAPGKAALYYSPCGNLFTNWAQVEKFLGPAVMKEVAVVEEKQPKNKMVEQETFKNEKSPSEGEKNDPSWKESSGLQDIKNKKKTPRSVEKLAFKSKDRMIESYSKLSGDLELSDDVISLSDEELSMETSVVEKKRKRTSEKESKSSKSKRHRTDAKKSSREKKAEKNSPIFSSLDSNRTSKAQEEILLAAFRQWPVAFPELVEALVKETKLEGSQVKQWFLRTRQDCLCLLWESL